RKSKIDDEGVSLADKIAFLRSRGRDLPRPGLVSIDRRPGPVNRQRLDDQLAGPRNGPVTQIGNDTAARWLARGNRLAAAG
ncbi:hypothetical protein ACSTHH_23730, partial [Vibrio parahaemolyticus]